MQADSNCPFVLPHFLHITFPTIPAISCVPEQVLSKSEILPHAVHIVNPGNETMLCSKIYTRCSSTVIKDKNYPL